MVCKSLSLTEPRIPTPDTSWYGGLFPVSEFFWCQLGVSLSLDSQVSLYGGVGDRKREGEDCSCRIDTLISTDTTVRSIHTVLDTYDHSKITYFHWFLLPVMIAMINQNLFNLNFLLNMYCHRDVVMEMVLVSLDQPCDLLFDSIWILWSRNSWGQIKARLGLWWGP